MSADLPNEDRRYGVTTLSGHTIGFVQDDDYGCVRFYRDDILIGIVRSAEVYGWSSNLSVATVRQALEAEEAVTGYAASGHVEAEELEPAR